MDNDMFSHVNNVVYFSYFDTAVTAYEIARDIAQTATSEVRAVVADARCRYHRSVSFPDRLTIGMRVSRIGGASVTYQLAVFREDEDEASAEGEVVHVFVDPASQRPVPIPPRARAGLTAILVEGEPP
jgi:acyl-CoA thioester hydrolase